MGETQDMLSAFTTRIDNLTAQKQGLEGELAVVNAELRKWTRARDALAPTPTAPPPPRSDGAQSDPGGILATMAAIGRPVQFTELTRHPTLAGVASSTVASRLSAHRKGGRVHWAGRADRGHLWALGPGPPKDPPNT